jgi:hypothetical protein
MLIQDLQKKSKDIVICKDKKKLYIESVPAQFISNNQLICSAIAKIMMCDDNALFEQAYQLYMQIPSSATHTDFIESIAVLSNSPIMTKAMNFAFCLNAPINPNLFFFLKSLNESTAYQTTEWYRFDKRTID